MIEALTKSLGVVTSACKQAGISRTMHYNYMKDDSEYRKQVEDIANIAIDFVESKLYELISNDDTTAVIFYLKTKAKKRGYVERSEIDHMGIQKISIDLSDLTTQELKQLNEIAKNNV